MAVKIGIANCKGGIGKSTTALALSAELIKRGFKVLMIDTDPQRNTTSVYRAKTEDTATLYDIIFAGYKATDCIQHMEYGDIIASDENLKSADTQIKPGPSMYKYIKNAVKDVEDYDFIIFDTQPYAGILLGNVLMASDYLIVPVSCDAFGIQGIIDFYSIIKEYQEDNEKLSILGLLLIKYKARRNLTKELEESILPNYADQMNTIVFQSRIRESIKCQEAQTLKIPLNEYAPDCGTAVDYAALTDEILQLLGMEGK